MRWLRSFFQSPDPIVKVAAGVSEPESGMLTELLENEGIAAYAKNMNAMSAMQYAGSLANDFDIFVKRSDADRAREILRPLLQPIQLVDAE